MPRLKTESEVATMQYLSQNTSVPVPTVYHYDSNPYNRLGGEFILMSKVKPQFHMICIDSSHRVRLPAFPLPKFITVYLIRNLLVCSGISQL